MIFFYKWAARVSSDIIVCTDLAEETSCNMSVMFDDLDQLAQELEARVSES